MTSTVIELQSIEKRYGNSLIFSEVNAQFREGVVTGLVGGNGSGKSVLFKIICGFVKPSAGTVSMANWVRKPSNTYPDGVGILIEGPGYVPGMTGRENLHELARIRRVATRGDILAWAERLGLAPHLDKKVRHYSVGTKQKLGLVQAMMELPPVLLLDEPFNALDEATSIELKRILGEWVRERSAVILTSHIPDTINEIASDRWEFSGKTLRQISS